MVENSVMVTTAGVEVVMLAFNCAFTVECERLFKTMS